MRSYEELSGLIRAGHSVRMDNGELVTTVVRIAEIMDTAPLVGDTGATGAEAEGFKLLRAKQDLEKQLADSINENETLRQSNLELSTQLSAAYAAHHETQNTADRAIKELMGERDDLKKALETAQFQAEKTSDGTGTPNEGLMVAPGQSATLTVNDDSTGSAKLDEQSGQTNPTPQGTPLPDGFPKRAQLAKAGLTTVEAVNEKPVDQLAKVDGVTPQTAQQIKEAVASLGK